MTNPTPVPQTERMKRVYLSALVALAATIAAADAMGQVYPSKPVRVIVPFTPGSGTDVLARTLSPKLSELTGQQFVVENRPGAGGAVAAGAVAKAAPDGYTLLWHSSAFTITPALQANLGYDPLKDFAPVSALLTSPLVLIASPSSGARTVAELIALAKAKPGAINYGSAGTGSGTHFAAEKFRLAAGIDAVHVPYKGGMEPTTDVIAGRLAYWFAPVLIAAPQARDGKVFALGVTGTTRAPQLPEVPTIAESLPGFHYVLWWGLWGPAGLPADVADKLARTVARALDASDMRERLTKLGAEPLLMSLADFGRFVREELAESARLVKAAAIKAE
jgi:tripartite-type tricarboxylate transporter receptor subunit TctC